MNFPEDNLEIFMGHVMLYQDSKFHKTDAIKARAIAKKYLSHLENHPEACLCCWLEKEFKR